MYITVSFVVTLSVKMSGVLLMICGKLYLRNLFCKFMLCSKCVYFIVFTREMIVYVDIQTVLGM